MLMFPTASSYDTSTNSEGPETKYRRCRRRLHVGARAAASAKDSASALTCVRPCARRPRRKNTHATPHAVARDDGNGEPTETRRAVKSRQRLLGRAARAFAAPAIFAAAPHELAVPEPVGAPMPASETNASSSNEPSTGASSDPNKLPPQHDFLHARRRLPAAASPEKLGRPLEACEWPVSVSRGQKRQRAVQGSGPRRWVDRSNAVTRVRGGEGTASKDRDSAEAEKRKKSADS